jgi:two-component system cell cycle sensor histidine kinase/response regulator CckA
MGNLEHLERILPSAQPTERIISAALRAASRAAILTQRLLVFSRRSPLVPEILSVNKLVAGMSDLMRRTLGEAVFIETVLAGGLWPTLADANQLENALINLAINARDAMPDGGTLRIEADDFDVDENYASMIPNARVGRYVRIRVSDTGSGIPPHLIDKIFDPFFTTKPIGKGTGLGLSTAVGIVRSHDGFIDVRSEVGKGTTFEVFLPAALDGAPSVARGETAAGPGGHGELILVVDDESAVREVTQSVLTENGYRTLAAGDGAEALSIFASQIDRIDAVFTDVMMPLVDGVALCRALKKMDPAVRIVTATGSGEESRSQELRSLNIGRMLGKPFTTGCLLSAIDEALAPGRGGSSAN